MSIKELQKNLLASVGEKLTAFGFGKKAKQQSFYRSIEGGWACVHLSFIEHADDFDVTVDVAVRFDEVEDLVNSKNNLLTKKEKAGTSTLGVELGNLSTGEQKRWSISSEDQISSVTDSILDAFDKLGEPYLLKYSSMGAAYELLSSDEKSVWKHCPFHATRAKKAIAISKLLDQPDIQNQISTRRQFLEDMKDFGLSDFVSFTNSLS
ncbi:hypothetical protein [Vibrio navarrensis]|uniref:DUF4304 domain-containing protein n=1 Tax=Vibrio navarrensis TaxID=29495 RepID=A0A099MIZ7_9VIBR|nr:hypothetical protein [Vibrio navarrensis]KGK10060.1 hypothetical protein EA26_01530 [Vibrio navarrensis]KGK20388.1 hypothetical protein EA25_16080 [Vibrio navarrensis]QOD69948.1 hypothetical protein IF132_14490 [Vibrio navarrensis]